jgi:hypothetical protein
MTANDGETSDGGESVESVMPARHSLARKKQISE